MLDSKSPRPLVENGKEWKEVVYADDWPHITILALTILEEKW